jgi:3-dehydrosphinganine reductase
MGANITILARRKDLMESASSEIKTCTLSKDQICKWILADVTDFKALEHAINSDKTTYDVLINSAGIAYPGRFVDMDPVIFKNVMDVNYLGTVFLTKLIVPKMIVNKSGYVVNFSSFAALVGYYGYTAYAPSKYAVRGFSRCLRSELKPYGVDVSVVIPQDTDTPQLEFERSHLPEVTKRANALIEKVFGSESLISAEKAADYVIEGINKRNFSIYFGAVSVFTYLLTPLIGRFFYSYTVKQAKDLM